MKRYERRKSAVKQKRLLAADQGTSQNLAPNLQHLDHPGSHSDNEEHGDTTPSLDLALAESDEPEHPLQKENQGLKEDVERLCGEVELLKMEYQLLRKSHASFSQASFENNDKKFRFHWPSLI